MPRLQCTLLNTNPLDLRGQRRYTRDMDKAEFEELSIKLDQGWGVSLDRVEVPDRHNLLKALAERVAHLLSHDFNGFLTAMYLLDVSEDRVKAAHTEDLAETSNNLAEVILTREIEKMESRKKYARKESPSPTLAPPTETDEG